MTGVAPGCPNPLYQFWLLPPGSSTWTVAQAYSPSTTFDWTTTGKTSGVYRVSVWARDAASAGTYTNSLGSYDAFAGSTYWLMSPCSSVTVSVTPASPSARGVAVTFNAGGTPCPNPLYQFWVLAPGSSTWTIAQAYSSLAKFSWATTGKASGTYHVSVWARDAASPGTHTNTLGSYDAFIATTYTLT
jgi:hypothetical protein